MEYRAIQEYAGIFRDNQGNVWPCREYWEIQENTGEYRGIKENTGEYSRIKGNIHSKIMWKMCI